jgi:glycosyltransferase involved in cell wall biosynthesis
VKKIVVVMPAFNAARTLARTWQAIPAGAVDEVLLVDDGSSDATLEVAAGLPIRVIALPHNAGYGANQKVCYLEALRMNADVVVMLHPDGQYDPALIPELVAPLRAGEADMVLGSRMLIPGGARAGRMPRYRWLANRALTTVENAVLGRSFSELHTGYRAYSASFLRRVPFLRNSNDFVFDSQIIAQAVAFRCRVAEVPIQTRYDSEASSTTMMANVRYGVATVWTVVRFALHRRGLIRCQLFVVEPPRSRRGRTPR